MAPKTKSSIHLPSGSLESRDKLTITKAHHILEETEAFIISNKIPSREKDYKSFLQNFIALNLDLQKILKDLTNDTIMKYKAEIMCNIRLKNVVLDNLKFLEDYPDCLRRQFIYSDYEFAKTLKIIYIIYVLNIKWLISHPVINICIEHYRTKQTSNLTSYLISPIVYIFYGIFAFAESKWVKDAVVRNLCNFYSVFVAIPIIMMRAYFFAYPPENFNEVYDYRILLLDFSLLIWFFSYVIQEATQLINESSIFRKENNTGSVQLNIATNFNFSFLNLNSPMLKKGRINKKNRGRYNNHQIRSRDKLAELRSSNGELANFGRMSRLSCDASAYDDAFGLESPFRCLETDANNQRGHLSIIKRIQHKSEPQTKINTPDCSQSDVGVAPVFAKAYSRYKDWNSNNLIEPSANGASGVTPGSRSASHPIRTRQRSVTQPGETLVSKIETTVKFNVDLPGNGSNEVSVDIDAPSDVTTNYFSYQPTPTPQKLQELKNQITERGHMFNEIDLSSSDYTNRKYFRSYWNIVDMSLLFMLSCYFICTLIDTTVAKELAMLSFYGYAVLIIFRLFEYMTPIIPGVSPFINAFMSMWNDIIVFLVIVAILALANAIGLSSMLCQNNCEFLHEPTSNLSTKEVLNENGPYKYRDCIISIFWYLFLTPLGTGTTLYSKLMEHTDDIQDDEEFWKNIKCYSVTVQHIIIFVITIYYISTAFCLLRGVIVKFVVSNREEAEARALYQKTRQQLTILFSEIDTGYPIPWNLGYFLVQVFRVSLDLIKNCWLSYRSYNFCQKSKLKVENFQVPCNPASAISSCHKVTKDNVIEPVEKGIIVTKLSSIGKSTSKISKFSASVVPEVNSVVIESISEVDNEGNSTDGADIV